MTLCRTPFLSLGSIVGLLGPWNQGGPLRDLEHVSFCYEGYGPDCSGFVPGPQAERVSVCLLCVVLAMLWAPSLTASTCIVFPRVSGGVSIDVSDLGRRTPRRALVPSLLWCRVTRAQVVVVARVT